MFQGTCDWSLKWSFDLRQPHNFSQANFLRRRIKYSHSFLTISILAFVCFSQTFWFSGTKYLIAAWLIFTFVCILCCFLISCHEILWLSYKGIVFVQLFQISHFCTPFMCSSTLLAQFLARDLNRYLIKIDWKG